VRIERLELENMISYERLSLDFPREGSIVFVGMNGAGKSTILDSILFALFRKNVRGRSNDILIRRGASYARVSLTFTVNGRRYRVERRITTSKLKQERGDALYEEVDGRWKLLATGREVSKVVSGILGVDEKLFTTAVYARQGEIAALLTMQPAKRKELLSSLLGIAELEKAYERMKDVINRFENRKAKLRGEVTAKGRVENSIRALEESLRKKKEEVLRTDRELKKAESELGEAERKLEAMKEILDRRKALKEELASVEARLEETLKRFENARKEYEESIKAEREVAKLREEIARLEPAREYHELERNKRLLEERRESLLRELERYEELSKACADLPKLEEELRRKEEERRKLEERARELDEEIWESRRAGEELKQVDEKLCRVGARIEEFIRRASEFVREVRPEDLVERLKVEREILDRRLEEASKKVKRLTEKRGQINLKIRQLRDSLSALEEAGEKCPLCGSPLSDKKREELLEEYRGDLERAERELEELARELEEAQRDERALKEALKNMLGLNLEEYEGLLREKEELERKVSQLRAKAASIDGLMKERKEISAKLTALEEEVKELRDRVSRTRKAREDLEKINAAGAREKLLETEAELRQVNARLSQLEALIREIGGPDQLPNILARLEEMKKRRSLLEGISSLKDKRRVEVEELEKTERELKERIQRLKTKLSELGFDEEAYRELEEKVKELTKRVGELKGRMSKLYSSIEEDRRRLKELREELAEILRKEEELRKIEKLLRDLEVARKVFSKDGAQRLIRERARPVIERYLKEIASHFDLDFLNIRLTEDYSIEIIDAGGSRDVSSASGGEKAALGLALRLALAKAVGGQKLGFMMLDEPTQNLDEERRRGLIKALRALFGREGAVFPQLLVVTHSHELEDAADQAYIVEKVGNKSRVRAVER